MGPEFQARVMSTREQDDLSSSANRKVRFSPALTSVEYDAPSPSPSPPVTPRASVPSFSARLRSSLKGLSRSKTSVSSGRSERKTKDRRKDFGGSLRPTFEIQNASASRGILVDPRRSSASAPTSPNPDPSLTPIPRGSSATRDRRGDFDAPRPSSVPTGTSEQNAYHATFNTKRSVEESGNHSAAWKPNRPGTPPNLMMPAILTESPNSPHAHLPKRKPFEAEASDGLGISSTTLFNTRIPSMRFDDLGASFTNALNRSIYAANGASWVSPPSSPRSPPRSDSNPAASCSKNVFASIPEEKRHSPEVAQHEAGELNSSRLSSPKRRRRESPLYSPAQQQQPTTTTEQSGSETFTHQSEPGSSRSSWLEVQDAPQVKVQPPTPVIDDGGFEAPEETADLTDMFEMVNSSSSWVPLEPTRSEPVHIRSIADITNDRSPLTPSSSNNSTPPLSPSTTADSMINSTCTSLTSASLMLSNAIDLCELGVDAPTKSSKGKARAIGSPFDYEEDGFALGDNPEDSGVQIEKLMHSLQKPYTSRQPIKSSKSIEQPHGVGIATPVMSRKKISAPQQPLPPPPQLNTGLDALKERFHRTWTPKEDFEDPFSFLTRSGTESNLSTGVSPEANAIQCTTLGRKAQTGSLEFEELTLDSPTSGYIDHVREDPEHDGPDEADDEDDDGDYYDHEGDEHLRSEHEQKYPYNGDVQTRFRRMHTPEGSLWDLQEAVVCMGDRVEVSGVAF